jgi:flagellar hook assembly protein FlgD
VASIDLTLAVPDRLRVVVHDIAGRAVKVLADRPFESGLHELVWDGTDGSGRRVASGVYVVRASAASGIREAKTLVVLR